MDRCSTCLACHHVDCSVTSSSDELTFKLRDKLKAKYCLTDTCSLKWHLGMHIVIRDKELCYTIRDKELQNQYQGCR
jgi:hypothetical protein